MAKSILVLFCGNLKYIRKNYNFELFQFLCVNDNLDYNAANIVGARIELQEFYKQMYPNKSDFELWNDKSSSFDKVIIRKTGLFGDIVAGYNLKFKIFLPIIIHVS